MGTVLALPRVAPSFDTATLFSTLGIGGVAFGLAFKDILQNLLAGLLLTTRPSKLGDPIVSGAHEGTIKDIELRATCLRTFDNRIVLIPNCQLSRSRVIVDTANKRRRASIQVAPPGEVDQPTGSARAQAMALAQAHWKL